MGIGVGGGFEEVAEAVVIRIGIAQVYLVKHRISAPLKKEVAALEKER